MWERTVLIGAGAVVALVVAVGCSNGDTGSEHPAGHMTSAPATATTSAPGAQAQAHNDADAMFAHHMIPHHEQAIVMSDIVLGKQGIDPRVTELANQIKAAQGPEIEQMQQWLTEWGNPPMPSMPPGDMNMPGHGDMPGAPAMPAMQGMMSEDELNALRNAQGVDAGRMFLTQMIAHHEGAIAMAQTEIDGGQYPPAVEMARAIVKTQQQEIDTMRGILDSL